MMVAAFSVVSWALFGGIALSMVYSEKPLRSPLAALARGKSAEETHPSPHVLAWWLLFLILAGVELSLFTAFASLFYVRKPLPPPRALPPLDAQSPPRCYLCGGSLHDGGLTRKCRYCASTNLVDGRAFEQRRSPRCTSS